MERKAIKEGHFELKSNYYFEGWEISTMWMAKVCYWISYGLVYWIFLLLEILSEN